MPQGSFLHALREFNHQFRLIERGERIILAVSGGIDSMVLVDTLCKLQDELKLMLAIAHFNHELRGKDSNDDESFVRSVAKLKGIECYVEHANTASIAESRKLSLQEAARDLRYKFLAKLRTSLGFQKIATAHHADDNAETILFNAFRGAGVQGLSGIPVMRKDLGVIRPLLFAAREEIREYAVANKVAYREDISNAQNEYTRNFLRNSLIPQIREHINPNLTGTLRRTGELFDQVEQYLKEQAAKVLPDVIVRRSNDEIVFDLNKFHNQPVFIQEHLLFHTAKDFIRMDIDFTAVKTMLKISHAETGSSNSISKDIVLFRNREYLFFRRVPKAAPFRYRIEPEQSFEFEQFRFQSTIVPAATLSKDPHTEYVNATVLGKELVLRSWSEGDWFIPLGMKEKKKLSDFFVDQKIPLFEKHLIPIFVSDGDIVWICGRRLDDRFKITSTTTKILKIEYTPRNHVS